MSESKIDLKSLIIEANIIKEMYKKAKIRLVIGEEVDEKVVLTLSENTTSWNVDANQIIKMIHTALSSLSDMHQKIIKVEILEDDNEEHFWYLKYMSRSTYFRYKKEAYYKFLSFFK